MDRGARQLDKRRLATDRRLVYRPGLRHQLCGRRCICWVWRELMRNPANLTRLGPQSRRNVGSRKRFPAVKSLDSFDFHADGGPCAFL
jgi:hypothetical protein